MKSHSLYFYLLPSFCLLPSALCLIHQIVYYLSSRQEAAPVFASKIRGHWNIENQLHWVLDVLFEEDSSPIRQSQPACNISILKTIGINLFRSEGRRQEAEGRRFLTAFDPRSFRAKGFKN